MIALLAAIAVVTPHATVTAMFAAFNAHDETAMARLYAPDARLTSSDFCQPRGRADVARTYRALFTDMPDIRDEIDTLVVQGDRVAVRFTATSQAKGFRLRIMTMLRVKDGLIVEDDSIFDTGGKPCTP